MKNDEKKIAHRALDGEASHGETRRLERRLSTDVHARAEFEQLKRIVQVSGKVHVEVPADFTSKVMKGVVEIRPPRRKS